MTTKIPFAVQIPSLVNLRNKAFKQRPLAAGELLDAIATIAQCAFEDYAEWIDSDQSDGTPAPIDPAVANGDVFILAGEYLTNLNRPFGVRSSSCRCDLHRYLEFDTTIHINPDEAGLFDMLADTSHTRPTALRADVDAFVFAGINPESEVLEVHYHSIGGLRSVMVTGMPPGVSPCEEALLGFWFITLEVRT